LSRMIGFSILSICLILLPQPFWQRKEPQVKWIGRKADPYGRGTGDF